MDSSNIRYPEKKGVYLMNINENVINRITDEQKKKAEAARSPEELLSIAKESGYVLAIRLG